MRQFGHALFLIAILLCKDASAQPQTATVVITPPVVSLAPGESIQLSATVTGAAQPLKWSLRGPRDPGSDWGKITPGGVYTAPLQAPNGQVYITATVFGQFGEPIGSASVPVTLRAGVAPPPVPAPSKPPVVQVPRPAPSVPPGVVAPPPVPQAIQPPQPAVAPPPPAVAKQFLFSGLFDFPDDLAWHENTLWGVNLVHDNSVSKINVQKALKNTGRGQKPPFNIRPYVQKTYTSIKQKNDEKIPLRGPTGLTSDGKHLWLATYYDKRIWQLKPGPSELIEVRSFSYQPGGGPRGLAWARGRLWVADDVHGRLYQLNPIDGAAISWFASPSPSGQPTGLAFDGSNLRLATYQDAKHWTLTLKGRVVKSEASLGPGPVGLTWGRGGLWGDDDKLDQLHD